MVAYRRKILLKGMRYFDLLATGVCFFAATNGTPDSLSRDGAIRVVGAQVHVWEMIVWIFLLNLWSVIFQKFGLYESRRLSSGKHEWLDVAKAQGLCAAVATPLYLVGIPEGMDGSSLPVFWLSATIVTSTCHAAMRCVLAGARRYGRNLRHVLIVGRNARAVRFAQSIESRPELGYNVIGYADSKTPGQPDFPETAAPLVTTLTDLPEFLRARAVDEVVICLPFKSFYQEASEIVALCEEQGVIVRFLSDLFSVKLANSRTERLEGQSIITLSTGSMIGWPVLLKRALDFTLSLTLIVLLSPVFLAAAVAVKLTSPGPVLFIQDRLGLNKRIFRIRKFRTMGQDAEKRQNELEELNEADGAVFKIQGDPRVTPVGRFLRKTSIDELPQLFNVLKGDMSLVGPRPLPIRDYTRFDTDWHRRRFSVRPGITCLWQVNGRNGITFDKWMALDIEYIDQWSLLLDFKIMLKTIPAVLKGTGAS
jgi:exopolysaccharide biosynthesis polyprenyl glycosylphosphotransferase